MTLLLGVTIRSSLMLAAGLAFSTLLRKQSAALRHRVVACSLLAAAMVTPFSLVLPAWNFVIPAVLVDPPPAGSPASLDPGATEGQRQPTPPTTPARPAAPARRGAVVPVNSTVAVFLVWLTGSLVVAGVLITNLLRVTRLTARGVRIEDPAWLEVLDDVARACSMTRHIVITRTDSPDLLGTWGIVKPEVLLPRESRDWHLERVRVVLSHELAHIRRHDWVLQIGAHLVCAVLWFNPLVWIVSKRLRCESERACDDEVLGMGVGAREYSAHLLELARQCRRPGATWASAIPMAHPSTLETRITAMLNPLLDRRIPSRRALSAIALGAVLLTLPVAGVRATQSAPAPLIGTVYDATGAVVPGVQVALVDANQMKWTAVSKATGRFELPPVGPGKFVLEATLPGFRALRQEFELRDPRDWERAVTLQVGALSETVHISAARAAMRDNLNASPADSQRIRIGGNIRAPKKEQHVAPIYPPAMIAAGLTGVVPVEAIIGQDGTVSSVRVLSAQVHPDFATAAVDAVRQWRFTPTLLNRVPVEVAMTVTVRFDLKD